LSAENHLSGHDGTCVPRPSLELCRRRVSRDSVGGCCVADEPKAVIIFGLAALHTPSIVDGGGGV
jgi:hypothetical protein